MNRRTGFARVLVVLLIAAVVGVLAYGAGVSAGQAAAAAPGGVPGTVVYPVGWPGFGFGFGIFGFLFLLLLIGLLVRVFALGGRGHGWSGPDRWDRASLESGEVPPPMDAMLRAWHRRAHDDPATATAPTPPR